MKSILITLMLFCYMTYSEAHQTSTSFINIHQQEGSTTGSWKISIESLNNIKSMDVNNDGLVKWSELKSNTKYISTLMNNILSIRGREKQCFITSSKTQLMAAEKLLDINYLSIPFNIDCSVNSIRKINYQYYFNYDTDHKGIVSLVLDDASADIHVLSSDKRSVETNSGISQTFFNLVKEGIWHILIGVDHVIFVITLIIGVLLTSQSHLNMKNEHIVNIAKVVTAFTIAHSITLGLASLSIVSLPARLIESLIAITIIYTALHNIRNYLPTNTLFIFSLSHLKMAFFFGLIHGFGFANVLAEINLSSSDIAMNLFAFNLGVEIGQLAIVMVFTLFVFGIIKNKVNKNIYLTKVVPLTSSLFVFFGGMWLIERSFDIAVF